MERIILPTHEPLITTYPHHANLFSIVDIDHRSLSWVFHNYLLVMLHGNADTGEYGLDLCSQYYPWHQFKIATCPMLISRVYQKEIVTKKYTLSEFIIELIRANNYVYFIRDFEDGWSHETFITGFDLSSMEFLCHDFWEGIYSEKWIPFDQMTIKQDDLFHSEWATDYLNGIWAIQKTSQYKTPNSFYYETVLNFSKKDLVDILKEYMGETNLVRDILKKDDRWVGIEIYEVMTDMLEKFRQVNNNTPLAIHPFHLLYEHKKLLSKAINHFMNSTPKVSKDIDALVNEALKLRNVVLYCNASIKKSGIYSRYDSIIESILKIKNMEMDLMRYVYALCNRRKRLIHE